MQRLLAVLEQLQVPVAMVREHLGIPGMDAATARNFRDKDQMKTVLEAVGVPCARHRLATGAAEAADFAREAGFPLVVKPPPAPGPRARSAWTIGPTWKRGWRPPRPPRTGPR